MPPDSKAIETVILSLAAARGPGKTISPDEAARALAGSDPAQWAPLMGQVRRAAVTLAEAGRIVIYRKGKEADPHDFRGVYRLVCRGTTRSHQRCGCGPGKNSGVRPASQ